MSFISYLTSTATSPYSKMVKSFFHSYFSFSNKVFYPVAYIMNELQHLTTPSSLKFCLALCFSSGPNSSKFGPSCPQVGSNFFHLAKEMATTFLEPERTPQSHRLLFSRVSAGVRGENTPERKFASNMYHSQPPGHAGSPLSHTDMAHNFESLVKIKRICSQQN